MNYRFFCKSVIIIFTTLAPSVAFSPTTTTSAIAQSPSAGSFKIQQRVEVEYIPNSGKWLPATVLEVLNGGYSYKVQVAPWDDGKTIQANIHYKRVRAASSIASSSSRNKARSKSTGFAAPILGKYACSVSEYNPATQMYEYKAKGSFTLLAGNAYRYNGFSKPSTGRYSFDAGTGKIRFHGGYFDKGEATPIPGYKNRYFLVSPTLPGHRWTCTLI